MNFDLQCVVQTLDLLSPWGHQKFFFIWTLLNILPTGLGPLFLFKKQSLLNIILSFLGGQEWCHVRWLFVYVNSLPADVLSVLYGGRTWTGD